VSSLRGLLKLEDKLAAEERRLEHLGGPSLGHLLPLIVVGAVALHVVILLLPAFKSRASLPAASSAQDFPMVWRPTPVPEDAPSPAGPDEPRTEPRAQAKATPDAPPAFEPVPEPSPDFAAIVNPDVDPLIPPPDALPPSVEPASPTAAAPHGTRMIPLKRVTPTYPNAARPFRAEARVTLQLTVAPDGSVADAVVLGSSRTGLGFEEAAVEAAKRWQYDRRDPAGGSRAVVVTVDFKRQGTVR
jgi:TonB family protein